jgi:hypothetical protein
MAKSAPDRLGPEIRVKRRHILIRVSIDLDQTAPLPQHNRHAHRLGAVCPPDAVILSAAAKRWVTPAIEAGEIALHDGVGFFVLAERDLISR